MPTLSVTRLVYLESTLHLAKITNPKNLATLLEAQVPPITTTIILLRRQA